MSGEGETQLTRPYFGLGRWKLVNTFFGNKVDSSLDPQSLLEMYSVVGAYGPRDGKVEGRDKQNCRKFMSLKTWP